MFVFGYEERHTVFHLLTSESKLIYKELVLDLHRLNEYVSWTLFLAHGSSSSSSYLKEYEGDWSAASNFCNTLFLGIHWYLNPDLDFRISKLWPPENSRSAHSMDISEPLTNPRGLASSILDVPFLHDFGRRFDSIWVDLLTVLPRESHGKITLGVKEENCSC